MYKKEFAYLDFDGATTVETLYFNLTRAEILRFAAEYSEYMPANSVQGDKEVAVSSASLGIQRYIENITKTGSVSDTIAFAEKLIEKAYGVRTPDGKHFRKSKEILDEFKSSAAYDEFLYQLLTDENATSEFVSNVFPVLTPEELKRAEGAGYTLLAAQ